MGALEGNTVYDERLPGSHDLWFHRRLGRLWGLGDEGPMGVGDVQARGPLRRAYRDGAMKKLADYGVDDHPPDDPERAQATWTVALFDDCEACEDLRVELTVEEAGQAGRGVIAHLSPATARRLRAALATALRDMGEPVDG